MCVKGRGALEGGSNSIVNRYICAKGDVCGICISLSRTSHVPRSKWLQQVYDTSLQARLVSDCRQTQHKFTKQSHPPHHTHPPYRVGYFKERVNAATEVSH
jgi:hypothetical protein